MPFKVTAHLLLGLIVACQPDSPRTAQTMTGPSRSDTVSKPHPEQSGCPADGRYGNRAATRPTPPESANLQFAVATIKSADNNESGKYYRLTGRTFIMRGYTVKDLLVFSLDLTNRQIEGGPSWLGTQRFDIAAVPDSDHIVTPAELRLMVSHLVEARFHLKYHLTTSTAKAYILNAASAKDALHLSSNTGDLFYTLSSPRSGMLTIHNISMAEFSAEVIQRYFVTRPVVDCTGLGGRYDFSFVWSPDGLSADNGETSDDLDKPSLFEAMRTQLGLALVGGTALVPELHVDSISEPTAN